MNQEFPLSSHSQNNGDFWTQGGGAPTTSMMPYTPPAPGRIGGSQSAKPSPMQKIHRLLRGRYPAAIVLAAACGAIGGLAGYMSLPPKFESDGIVQVSTIVPNATANDGLVPSFANFMATHVGLIAGEDVAELALKDPNFIKAWDDNYPNTPLPTKADMVAAIDPEHVKNSALIKVAFVDKKKGVAEAGCRAMLSAYMTLHGNKDGFSLVDDEIAYNNEKLTTAKNSLAYEETVLGRLREKYGSIELEHLSEKMLSDLADLERQVDTDKTAYGEAQAALQGNAAEVHPMTKEEVYNQIANLPNRQMQILLQNWEDAKQRLRVDAAGLGPNHPRYQFAQLQVDAALREVDDYARSYLGSMHNQLPGATLTDHVTPEVVAQLKQRYVDRKAAMEEMKEKAKDLGYQMDQIAKTRETIRTLQLQINGNINNIAGLSTKRDLNKPVVLNDAGSEAQVPTDKRKLVAAVGFIFGGILPVGLMLLYGLTENRYRFSSDANEHDMLGTTLLGILPNLPDRLSDPQQAGVAAHCVHQIRTMLQISRSNDEPQVLAITSASSGDGKTSLCLALGLSYAACGARTLLVDCDLVAAGLTHRLNVNSTDGVLEAVANRALLEYVRTTDIADVAILPVGTTHAHHASTLSPVALRRLISEGKKHFDIIIIDTGPLLGSIEASLVCAAADRSILAVARNQQRPLVERSIRHLQEIGAHLAGVVFNRAHASDFESSMSGLALRSRPAPGAPGVGPATNMAGSFKKKAG